MAANLTETQWSNPAVVQDLEQLFGEGLSYSLIARRINEKFGLQLTRNACLGKAARLGLTRPYTNCESVRIKNGLQLPTGPRAGTTSRQKGTTKRGTVVSLMDLKAPEGVGISLDELKPFSNGGSTSCRYPLGMCESAGLMFCGEPTEHGSWCSYHCEVVFKGGRLASAS